ncbi:helix-turn-helix domain-containing protein [Herbaspirillum chlorophenolicum]|uniref:helix-turn-helix domain-containing protein n=1 Tax=Herbaspirillum chlorophenolicum TaxID=211589 RepID=UPI0009E4E520|nr:helix-turn-helix transcriptional regulator [Herbaspirillum chlorophenolicum]
MDKKIYTLRYQTFLSMLKEARAHAGLAQRPFAELLGVHQTYISKVEVGERRLDIAELSFWCEALGISFDNFMNEWHIRYVAAEIAAKSVRAKKTGRISTKAKPEAKAAKRPAAKAARRPAAKPIAKKTLTTAATKAPRKPPATTRKAAVAPVKRLSRKVSK